MTNEELMKIGKAYAEGLSEGLADNEDATNDLISRQKVLSLAKDVTLQGGCKHRCIDATLIYELPSAEPEWIPCSERLPEDRSKTLVTTEWGDDDGTVEYATYWDDYIQWGPITKNVVAWMLAPTPYRKENR